MIAAIAGLFAALIEQNNQHRAEIERKDQELIKCQEERTKAEAAFRAEISSLFREVQAFREEIYKTTQAQQRQLKRLR